VRIGVGALEILIDELAEEWRDHLFVLVSDSNVAALHARPLRDRLADRGLRAETVEFPAGEASKTRATLGALEDRLYELGADRQTVVLGVGGGVTGDLAGFLASVWHRGVPVVQVPTSVLAMVDSSVGGKTGVNLGDGKNLLGTVHQPWGIYADVALSATLPDEEYASGFAEVIKSAAIADVKFFRWLERAAPVLIGRDPSALEEAVVRCVEIKGRVVLRDERESGRRAMLNFGHTVAHALEAVTGYRISHGNAVAIGICLEARIAAAVAEFPPAHVRRLERVVEAFGLPTRLPDRTSVDALIAASRRDKKARSGRVRYALPQSLGKMPSGAVVAVPVDDRTVRSVLELGAT
jgi:3-dehydroquinate synthase